MRRHWLYLVLCLLLSGVAADNAARQFTSYKYNYEAQLLYNRLGTEDLGYEAPWLMALTPIVHSSGVLDGVRQELGLNVDLETLSEAITVEVPYESSLFRVHLEWPEAGRGEAILQSLIDHFVQSVAATRNASIGQTSGGVNSSMYDLESNLQGVRRQIHEFNARHRVLDLERDLMTLRSDIETLDKSLGAARQRTDGLQAQLQTLTDTASDKSRSNGTQLVAAQKARDLERWQVLRELVNEEERRIQQHATLEFQEKEYERARQLHEKKLISDADFDAIASQVKILRSMKDPSLQGLRKQIENIESSVPAIVNSGGLPATLSDASIQINVELAVIAGEWETRYFEKELEQHRKRMEELTGARIEYQTLQSELNRLTNEKARLQERQTNLQIVRGAKPIEFSVIQEPAPAVDPVRSNRNKLVLGVFGGCLLLLTGPLFLRENRASRRFASGGVPV
jgi:uncharacterized protein involved in exopolysaccharide biosynthesis